MNSQLQNMDILPLEDLLNTILCDLKRSVREYTTATTESNCPSIRQLFTEMTNSTLKLQGDLYQLMSQNNMYTAPTPAPRTEVSKQLQSAQQTIQKAQQFVQQRVANTNTSYQPQSNVSSQQSNYM
ncbi:spore coat protein [Paenibacillus anaericanus]|uniref:Spore coat protein n=2 Tax=Paenibacillus TaxID=44249 RepID=A0A3S1K8K9_9BACL|nr:spore coat protein [Paenibacillus anaericanus]RUT46329.1 spore coat protein [Paenibacillus anaericanus]